MSCIPIIIYSYNRHHYLNRILSYYQKQNYDQYLIIADGSEKEWPQMTDFKGKYLHLSGVSFRERLIAGLEQTQSDLAVLCADDDFLVPDGLEVCAEFLRNNSDYSCAHGNYGRFVINEGKISYTQKYASAQSIVDNDSLERVKKAFIPQYIPHVYAVHRRINLEKILNCQDMRDYEYLFNFEILLTFSSLIDGKAKRLPHIYNFREMENNKVGINNNTLSRKKITDSLYKCNLYMKQMAKNEDNRDAYFNLINESINKLMEYHLIHYSNSISKKSNTQTNKKNIKVYLSKLKNPDTWVKVLNLRSLINILKPRSNSFPLNDKHAKKEFEIIDKTLNNWIKNKNNNLPES